MSVDLNPLRERLPDSLRARLPADGGVLAWLAALGPELADALRELPIAELEAALEELVAAESEALPVTRTKPDIIFSATPTPAWPLMVIAACWFMPPQ